MSKIDRFYGAHKRGEINFSSVSGVATTKKEMISFFDKEIKEVDIITTKSYQVVPNPGNREPIITEITPGSFGNSVGLRNPGMDSGYNDLSKMTINSVLNVSVSASNPEDFITLFNKFNDIADSIELNFSCPHASSGFGATIGSDINIATDYVKQIASNVKNKKAKLLIKLTPNVDNIGDIAKSVIDAGADGIVAINTVGPELYIHKDSGLPILLNKVGGKGGKSGLWVRERAVECVKQIRDAIGSEPLLIGMGGVAEPSDVVNLVKAGADAIGLGSVFGKVEQSNWPIFVKTLKEEAQSLLNNEEIKNVSQSFRKKELSMEYKAYTVKNMLHHTDDMAVITLDGKLDCKAGEFAFLFLPGKGEKPFSVACNTPLTFVIRKKGVFTQELFKLKEGDKLYIRGLYGKPFDPPQTDEALCLAGGCGAAVLPLIAEELKKKNVKTTFLSGTSTDEKGSDGKTLLQDIISSYGEYKVVADNGKIARVLDELPIYANPCGAAYIIGPDIFMKRASEILIDLGYDEEYIFLSLEKTTLCGVGLCGECACGDKLTCQNGTFLSYKYVREAELLS